MWLMILLKVTEIQGFNLSLENRVLEKQQENSNQPPSPFRVKAIKECKRKGCKTKECKFTPNLQSLIAHFLHKMAHYFFVKFVNLSYILVFV